MTAKINDTELANIRNVMAAKTLATDDFLKVKTAIERLHSSLLRLDDPNQPWSFQNRAKPDAVVVIGAFRAGKTFCVGRSIARLKPIAVPGGTLAPKPIHIKAPASMSVEALGRDLLGQMRLTPARALGAALTMERLHKRLRLIQPTLIHIDEAQRLLAPERVSVQRLPEEQKKIFSHLRSLMDLDEAPIPVVLSGTRELIPFMERTDLGFFRDRKDIILLEPMVVGKKSDRDCLGDALEIFAEAAGVGRDLMPPEFEDRLILAANYARGLAFEIMQEAILIALADGRKSVGMEDFEAFYARKAGCYRTANPFAATDWQRIDPKALLAAMSGPDAPKIGDVRK